MPEPPVGGMEPEVRKKCFQVALLPDFNIRDGGRREGRAAQSTETGSRENRASSTLALNVNDNTKQGPGLCDLYKWKWSPRPAQALAQGRLPKGLAMHKVLKKRRPPPSWGRGAGVQADPGASRQQSRARAYGHGAQGSDRTLAQAGVWPGASPFASLSLGFSISNRREEA